MSDIGSTHRCARTFLQSFGLARFRAILTPSEIDLAAKQTGCAPKRQRTLVPEVVCWLMMLVALHTESMTQGLLRAWGWVRATDLGLSKDGVSEEAFCLARGQLTLSFWRMLWRSLQSRYEERFDSAMRWKKKYRVLAVDGSDVNLPNHPNVTQFFPRPKNDKGEAKRPQGRLVALCSVFTGFCLSFKFTSLRFTEHTALLHLIRKLRKNDLLLLDRGFFSLRSHLADRTS